MFPRPGVGQSAAQPWTAHTGTTCGSTPALVVQMTGMIMRYARLVGKSGRLVSAALLVASGIVVAGVLPAPTAAADPVPVPAGTSQMITVNAPTSTSTTATVTAWQRGSDGQWRVAIPAMGAHVGGAGVGHATEGSDHTPAGTFALTQAFGRQTNPGTKMPYFKTDTLDWWDENPASPTYNLHVRQTNSPGAASENLYNSGSVYDYVVNMDYNMARVPGAGSAFFLHVTDGTPTAGCVAVARSGMVAILKWLNPALHPYISIRVGPAWKPSAPPIGSVDSVKSSGVRQLTVRGWAADPSAPGVSEQVHVYVSGPAGTRGYAGTMTRSARPDVARVHPWAGGRTGFSTTVSTEGAGVNTVCVYAITVHPPGTNPQIGCRSVLVQNSFGVVDSVKVAGTSIVVRGWALNPNDHAEHVQVQVYDTSSTGTRGYPGFLANLTRADVARVYPGYGTTHGYAATIPAGAKGPHRVCAFAITTGGGTGNPVLGCRTVTV